MFVFPIGSNGEGRKVARVLRSPKVHNLSGHMVAAGPCCLLTDACKKMQLCEQKREKDNISWGLNLSGCYCKVCVCVCVGPPPRVPGKHMSILPIVLNSLTTRSVTQLGTA